MQIQIKDAGGSTIVGPSASMNSETTAGIYNYSYAIGASVTEGIWETIVNATKSSTSYYAHEFWTVTGGPFDVRTITIINPDISNLNISVISENTGGANKDMTMNWNLTRVDNGAILDSGSETRMVPGSSTLTWYINPTTTYVGQVKITFLGYYGPSFSEKAGAYSTFSSTDSSLCGDGTCNGTETCSTCPSDCGTCPVTDGGGSSGGGGGGGIRKTTEEELVTHNKIEIESDYQIFLTKNIEKTVFVKIKNIDSVSLSNIQLELEGLDSSIYTIDSKTIETLKPQETKEIKIRFFITEIIDDKDFNYSFIIDDKTYKKPAKLLVFSTAEYFAKELELLRQRAQNIKSQTNNQKILDELNICEGIIDILTQNINNEEFISAIDNIKKANECINNVENKIKTESKTPIHILSFNTIILIISIIIILIILIIALIILYKIYRNIITLNIMQSIDRIKVPNKNKEEESTSIKEKNFNEKIKAIEKKLKE